MPSKSLVIGSVLPTLSCLRHELLSCGSISTLPPLFPMNPPYTLVVVDMQADFAAAKDEATIVAVEKLIEQAKHDNAHVVFLWIPYYSPADEKPLARPLRRLLDLVSGYARAKVIEKLGNDGSCLVRHYCSQQGCSNSQFVICGVNTDMCVLDTALGLARSNPAAMVTVHRDACNTTFNKDCWDRFGVEPNIVLR